MMNLLKKIFKKIFLFYKRHEYLRVFTIIWGITFLTFAFQSIPNGLALPVNGDYCLQQLHFYVEGHDAFINFFKTGEFQMWSYEGFLGYNYFAGNTFYYLTSPFSLPIFLLPAILIPQGIFLMMTVKMAFAGTVIYILLKKFFHTSSTAAYVGGFAYALCGWGFYYIWFNHFHDVLAVLPLTLLGVEYCIQKRKGWPLAVGLAVCGLVNYYFLFTFVFTTLMYALFRYFQCFKKNKGHNLSIILQGVAYSALGVGFCGFIIFPAFSIIGSVSRVNSSSLLLDFLKFFFDNPLKSDSGYVFGKLKSLSTFFDGENLKGLFNYLFIFDGTSSTKVEKLIYPFLELVFPATSSWENALFSNSGYDNYVSNLYVSTPLLMLLWPTIIEAFRSKKVWRIIGSIGMLVMPFVPFFYYLFGGFSTVLYGRWLIFVVVIIVIATAPTIDRLRKIPRLELDISLLVSLTIIAISVTIASTSSRLTYDWYHVAGIIVLVLYQLLIYYIIREELIEDELYIIRKKVPTKRVFLWMVTLDLVICGNIALMGQGVKDYWQMYGGQDLLNEQRKIVNEIKKEDESFYRIFNTLANRDANNLALTLGYKGLGSFHSLYNTELDPFIQDWTRASYSSGNWSMGIDEKRYNLDTFLNVKYYLVENDDNNIPLGFSKYKSYDHYTIYKNDYFVELGYAFDQAIPYSISSSGVYSTFFNVSNNLSSHFMRESLLTDYALINEDDLLEIQEKMGSDLTVPNSYLTSFTEKAIYADNMFFKPRERDKEYPLNSSYLSALNSSYIEKLFSNTADSEYNEAEKNFRKEYGYDLYGPWEDNNLTGDKIIVRFEPGSTFCPLASEDEGYHVIVNLAYGPNVNISFYHDDELITSDHHGVNYYDHSSDHKFARGFYVDKSVTRIEIEVLNDTPTSLLNKHGFKLFSEPFSDYKSRMEKLAAEPLNNIKHTNNTLDFTTSYTTKKFVVLSVPYDKGWTLKVNDNDEKIYKVDAGFIGFIAEEGENTYHLEYVTPGITKGLVVSGMSLGGFAILTGIILYVEKKKKKIEIVNEKEKSSE